MSTKRLAVIGGGAAGYFCAVNAARMNPDLQVTLYEKGREVLSKVRISGGGRCNVTHHCFDNEVLARAYPRGGDTLRWAFEQFDARDTVDWFSRRGVQLKTEEDGRMFPVTDDSGTVIACLKDEARRHNVRVHTKTGAEAIRRRDDGSFRIILSGAAETGADAVLIAPGGFHRRSAYNWLEELGHTIEPPVPSLFTFNFRKKVFSDLAGISVPEAEVEVKDSRFCHTGPLLITHWGLSGPAVLKTSAWAARYLQQREYRFDIRVNWVHPDDEDRARSALKKLRDDNARKLVNKQQWYPIPARLWEKFLELAGIAPDTRWAEVSNRDIHELTRQLTGGTYAIQGKTTYKEEFVTCGGIPLGEVNFGTMESRKMPGVYFAGEVLDIDGITGGYNFQSAWTTGYIAARAIAGSG